MPTNLNTQRIIDTLREPPCHWLFTDAHIGWVGRPITDHGWSAAAATIREQICTMQCIFSPDLPEHIATRNMNYLLVFVAAAGAPDAVGWLTNHAQRAAQMQRQKIGAFVRGSVIKNGLSIHVMFDFQRSLTTITIRPCKARVYES